MAFKGKKKSRLKKNQLKKEIRVKKKRKKKSNQQKSIPLRPDNVKSSKAGNEVTTGGERHLLPPDNDLIALGVVELELLRPDQYEIHHEHLDWLEDGDPDADAPPSCEAGDPTSLGDGGQCVGDGEVYVEVTFANGELVLTGANFMFVSRSWESRDKYGEVKTSHDRSLTIPGHHEPSSEHPDGIPALGVIQEAVFSSSAFVRALNDWFAAEREKHLGL